MRVLVIGSGGREHALAWRLRQSPSVSQVIAVPGNPGAAQVANCLPAPCDWAGFVDLAEAERIDLTIVGPEAPLVAGIVDMFRARDLAIIGPTANAARLEGSKLYAKNLFERAGIPTARRYPDRKSCRYPVVVKADGLAGGKGVAIAESEIELLALTERLGPNVLYEEYLEGEEVSFIVLTDGSRVTIFPPSQDHKRARDNDEGPNTGGMGAYCDERILNSAQQSEILERIISPALREMEQHGDRFTGFLYAGLMLTAEGPKILEFNVRMGDPETEVLLRSTSDDFAELLQSSLTGSLPASIPYIGPSACVILAARGYPEAYDNGQVIEGLPHEDGEVVVFHAGTTRRGDQLVTSGGRVLAVTATGRSLPDAVAATYRGLEPIHFEGMQFRRDIGRRGVARW